MSEKFMQIMRKNREARHSALAKAAHENSSEAANILASTLRLCHALENNGFPFSVSAHAKHLRERIEAQIRQNVGTASKNPPDQGIPT